MCHLRFNKKFVLRDILSTFYFLKWISIVDIVSVDQNKINRYEFFSMIRNKRNSY